MVLELSAEFDGRISRSGCAEETVKRIATSSSEPMEDWVEPGLCETWVKYGMHGDMSSSAVEVLSNLTEYRQHDAADLIATFRVSARLELRIVKRFGIFERHGDAYRGPSDHRAARIRFGAHHDCCKAALGIAQIGVAFRELSGCQALPPSHIVDGVRGLGIRRRHGVSGRFDLKSDLA
jgi:hypothetical protein